MTRKRLTRKERRAASKANQHDANVARLDADHRSSGAVAAAICVALIALVGFIYSPVDGFQFISLDDPQYVSANPMVLNGLTWEGISQAFSFSGGFYWHPLTWISHMIDVQLFGVDPGAHHVVNAVIHAVNSVLLFVALRQLTGADARSAFVAALFAVHPLHVESVAWVSERKDVLSTTFWMASLVVYAGYARIPRFWKMLLLIAIFAAGLLAKPMILTLPFVLLLLDYWPLHRIDFKATERGRIVLRLIGEKAALFALAGASLIVTVLSQRGSGAVVSIESLSVWARAANAVVSYVFYLRDMIWPTELAAFYPYAAPSLPVVVICAVIFVVVTVAAIRLASSLPYLAVGWFWYVGVLVPVIGLVQAGNQGRADRFTYVPLVGIFIAIVWGAGGLATKFRQATTALVLGGVAIVLAFSYASRVQLAYWKDDLAVWGRAVSVTKGNYRAENHYGVALTDRGRNNEGIDHYLAALRIWPEYPEAHNNLGTARMEQQQFDAAIHEFSEAVRVKPTMPTFHYNLGVALSAKGDTASAIAEIRKANAIDPRNPEYSQALRILGATSF